jgi:hypothetical protein
VSENKRKRGGGGERTRDRCSTRNRNFLPRKNKDVFFWFLVSGISFGRHRAKVYSQVSFNDHLGREH